MTAISDLTYPDVARILATAMRERGEWAGCPVPLEGFDLRIEDRYPYKRLEEFSRGETDSGDDFEIVNQWRSKRRGCFVIVARDRKSADYPKPRAYLLPSGVGKRVDSLLHTLGASTVWDMQMETKAIELLAGHVEYHTLSAYLLTGSFLETSKRSGITYLFRRLRPTIAMRSGADGVIRILCALCLHPIAYYEKTYAGSMTPTDDVLAHLLLARGDEHLYWRMANQHDPNSVEAGI